MNETGDVLSLSAWLPSPDSPETEVPAKYYCPRSALLTAPLYFFGIGVAKYLRRRPREVEPMILLVKVQRTRMRGHFAMALAAIQSLVPWSPSARGHQQCSTERQLASYM